MVQRIKTGMIADDAVTAAKLDDSTSQLFGFRNRIINGDMRIAQRGTSFNAPADDTFILDRFAVFRNGTGAVDVEQSSVAPEGFTNSLLVTVDTADTSLGGTDFGGLRYVVEGYDIAQFDFGKATAKQLTLSFYVRSNITGTYSVSFRNSAADRYYAAEYTINSANTWERKSITITADTSGTWLTDNGKGIDLRFCLWEGGFSGSPNTWGSGNVIGSNNTTESWIATVNNNFYITGIQLEIGSVATPFERRPYGTELQLCQRYFYKSPQTANGEGFITYQATGGFTGTTCFPVTMRATPTMTYGYTSPYTGNTFNRVDTGGTITVTLSQNLVSVSRVMTIFDGGQSSIPLGTNFSTYLTASAEL